MGFHICVTNEKVIDLSLDMGVYGNVGNSEETRQIVWGKVRDLYAIKPGDLVVLFVKNPKSYITGIYEVCSMPYFVLDDFFEDPENQYPYRFNFKIKYNFPNPVPSFEFYSLIENGKINSMGGLERDSGSSYRGIRQLFMNEFNEILYLFHKYNPKTKSSDFDQIDFIEEIPNQIQAIEFDYNNLDNYDEPTEILFDQVPSNGNKVILENVLHAYIVYNILHGRNDVKEVLGMSNFSELILEAPVFKSMQYRSDILATFQEDGRVFYHSFFELKKSSNVGINEISQLIGYLKSFASNKKLEINSYEGVYISSRFQDDLIDYLEKRRSVEKENIISLFEYSVDDDGFVSFESRV